MGAAGFYLVGNEIVFSFPRSVQIFPLHMEPGNRIVADGRPGGRQMVDQLPPGPQTSSGS